MDENNVWMSSRGGGITHFNNQNKSFHQYHFERSGVMGSSVNIAMDLHRKSANELWVSSEQGLYSFHIPSSTFSLFRQDTEGLNQGPKKRVRGIFEDNEGNIWMGSRIGIFKIDHHKNKVRRISIENRTYPSQNVFPNIAGLRDSLLVTGMGTGDGVIVFDLKNDTRMDFPGTEFKEGNRKTVIITSALETQKGAMLFSSSKGLLELDLKEQKLKKWSELPQNQIAKGYDMFEDSRGNIWLSGNGFRCIVPKENKEIVLGHGPEERNLVDNSWNQGIGEDPQGRIWLSSRFGVNVFDYSTMSVTQYPAKDYPWLIKNDITDLAVDKKGFLWVAVRGEGLVRTHTENLGKDVRVFTTKDGMHSNTISALFIDSKERVYAGGVNGLSILELIDDSLNVATMDQSDFLLSPSVNHAEIREMKNGLIAIPDELDGILLFDPKDIFQPELNPPKIYIDHIAIKGENHPDFNAYSTVNYLEIAEKDSEFQIEIGNLAFALPEKIITRYRLKGLNSEWKPVVGSTIRYSFLPHEEYKLEVQSRYPVQSWGETTLVSICILPAFYQTSWFIALCMLLLLAVVFVVVRIRIQSVRKQEQVKSHFNSRLAEVEMQALRAQMNPHFLFNCLNSINGFILKNNAEEASDYLTKFSRLMRLILHNSKSSIVPIKNELEALQLYVHMESARVNNGFSFELNVAPEVEEDFLEVPPLILQPFVENAIWHGIKDLPYGEGKLKVDISLENGVLICTIEDNGIGRNASAIIAEKAAKKHKSMGMQITSDRLNLADYLYETQTHVEIEDLKTDTGEARGTRVKIHIHLKHV